MEALFKPDVGVTILTICNFLLLVYLLKKFAWKGIIGALEKREQQVADDKKQAHEARVSAEQLKAELDEKLNRIAEEAAQKMAQAVKTGETQRDQLLAQAKEQSARLVEQARLQIEAEKNQALAEVRAEIVRTAMIATEKMIAQNISQNSAQAVVDRVLEEVKKK
ncbi:MAG: F0F1 ATP synthase subunit B [Elusimicrobiaceae bacterium]|nr:F0F1 ATP synthase subunit B [Elusimicrobiaceae bacterium]